MLAELLISPPFSFPLQHASPADLLDGIIVFFFWITAKTSTSSLLFSLFSPSHMVSIPLFPYLSSSALCYLSLALPAGTAYLCEPMIYHLLIRADYGAFHMALICCWACFSLHSCQLSFRQPANRPVSVSCRTTTKSSYALYTSMHAQANQK